MSDNNNNQSKKTEFFVNLNNPKKQDMAIKANSIKDKKVIPTNMFILQDGKQCPMTIMIDD